MANPSDSPSMSQDEALQILSIDDQTEVSKAIQQYFEADGHSVDTASDGVEGLEMASRTSYDVVLLDLLMPKMDGMEFCRRIRPNAQNAEVGIIVRKSRTLSNVTSSLHKLSEPG